MTNEEAILLLRQDWAILKGALAALKAAAEPDHDGRSKCCGIRGGHFDLCEIGIMIGVLERAINLRHDKYKL